MSAIRIMAVDVGFVCTGLAALEPGLKQPGPLVGLAAITPPIPNKATKVKMYVADMDAQRVAAMARGILDFADKYGANVLMVELPSAGAQGARANRCMGMSTAMIATIVEARRYSVVWLTPNDTRIAATGSRTCTKDEVIAGMKGSGYAYALDEYEDSHTRPELEAVADALATYEAGMDTPLGRALARVD